jgi:anti-sigma regulatory factor (Ser/Thr protein kinase)
VAAFGAHTVRPGCDTVEVDCYLEAGEAHALPVLRRELMTYLRRHGDPGGDFDSAELLIGEAVENAVRHTAGPVSLTVEN